ncbi:hypothetical protein [Acinetobacter calcoaceticus]|uniref:hypothetical protein n=1 Tax=Acinetobacter calcoaceticus TaxID=471 RepID=UPI001D190273|nr:hypothetical protein [Acinetobacter calcoaceticus]
MIDLKTKQAFWAEQLPIFKEKYWIHGHLDVLEFDMLGGFFEFAENVKTDLSENDLFEIYPRVNSGWAMWKKAVNFMQETAKSQEVPNTHLMVEKKKIENWYLNDSEGMWLEDTDWLCDIKIGEVEEVPRKEYLVTDESPRFAAITWDESNDDVGFYELFETHEEAQKAAEYCKKMCDASKSGAEE